MKPENYCDERMEEIVFTVKQQRPELEVMTSYDVIITPVKIAEKRRN